MATSTPRTDLLIAVVTSGRAKQEWEWAKWLPHVQSPSLADGIGRCG